MKNSDMSRRFRARTVTNIVYATLLTCLIEIFLIANVSMVAEYLRRMESDSFLLELMNLGPIMALLYVLAGIGIFSLIFLRLQEKHLKYLSRISTAIRDISEGDLNTNIEVKGDDEFTAMAVNLNRMVEDIRRLMEKEREAERTKNELITNVAHDLRTPSPPLSDIWSFYREKPSFRLRSRRSTSISPMRKPKGWKSSSRICLDLPR